MHLWDIEPPNGPTSKAVCKRCGAENEFRNSLFGQVETAHEEVVVVKDAPIKAGTGTGGNIVLRAKQLKPARQKAEELFREGKTRQEIAVILEPAFGRIASSTLIGWQQRMPTVAHKSKQNGDMVPRLWEEVLAARPSFSDKERCCKWKAMLDAAFELLVL